MSLILEALRKMEQDRNSRRGAAQNLRPEVLRYRGKAKPQGKMPYLGLGIGALLLVCGIGAGFLLKGNHQAVKVSEPAPLSSVQSTLPVVAPAVPAAAVVPIAAAPGTVALVQPVAQPLAQSTTPQLAVPVPAQPAEPRRVRQVEAAVPVRSEPALPAQQKPARRDATALSPAPADIAISGIAWQEERSLRRAVVNGSLVGEGAEVSGAHVVEIRDDRVRLSRGGQLFEVLLSSSFSGR